jgi:site-specific DNA-methyltransferase (adenine-specific)
MSTPPKIVDSPQDAEGCSLPASPCSSLLDLRLADCMDVMREAPDNHWDLAIVDPPYGIGWDGEGSMADNNSGKWSNARGVGYARKQWDRARPDPAYFAEVDRVSRNLIIWGGNYFADLLPPSGGWIVWEKGVPETMTLSQAELAYVSHRDSIKVCKILWAGFRKCEEGKRLHPTQKPVKLYDWILANYAQPGDRILDTHMGSGSIAIACHYAGHHLTACEIDPDYYAAAVERIDRETAQMDFFSTNSQALSPGETGL